MSLWNREQRSVAKAKNKVLFRASIDGSTKKGSATGKYDLYGPEDESDARLMFFFCCAIRSGKTPQRALKMGMFAMKEAKKVKHANP